MAKRLKILQGVEVKSPQKSVKYELTIHLGRSLMWDCYYKPILDNVISDHDIEILRERFVNDK